MPSINCGARSHRAGCGSTPRARAIIRAFSTELFGRNLVLADFPVSREISGLGMTDWEGYAARLAEKFSYTNTYYHQEPKLDISNPEVPENLLQSNDFIISSEIFEHVVPPCFDGISKHLQNAQTGRNSGNQTQGEST